MKAKRLVFPEKMKVAVESFEVSDRPGEGEVLIENLSSLVSPGTELAMFTESHVGFKVPDFGYAKYPFRPGYAAVGRVLARGAGVTALNEGDLVFHRNNHASHALLPKGGAAFKLPSGIASEEAPFAALAAIALTAVRLSSARLGDTVAVFGQGPVGNLAAQLFQLAGARVVHALDTLPERLALSRACGLNATLNPLQEKPPVNCRIVVEATGHPATLPQALKAVAWHGEVILLGSPTGRVEIDPYFDVHRPGIKMIGAHAMHLDRSAFPGDPAPEALMLDFIAQGRLKIKPLITHHLPVSQAGLAYRGLLEEKRKFFGVILNLNHWE